MSRRVIYIEEEKFCKDCKYCELADEFSDFESQIRYAKCGYPVKIHISPLSGKQEIVKSQWKYCSVLRGCGLLVSFMTKSCGKRGRWFEPKDE